MVLSWGRKPEAPWETPPGEREAPVGTQDLLAMRLHSAALNHKSYIPLNRSISPINVCVCVCVSLSVSFHLLCYYRWGFRKWMTLTAYVHVSPPLAFQPRLLVRLVRLSPSATGLLLSVDKYLITFHQVVWLYITSLSPVLHSSDYYRFSRSLTPRCACQGIFAALSWGLVLAPTFVCSLFSQASGLFLYVYLFLVSVVVASSVMPSKKKMQDPILQKYCCFNLLFFSPEKDFK